MNLTKLVVLFLDCQTTAANPKKGRVIELGWARSDPTRDCGYALSSLNAHLLKLPAGDEVPERIQKITGIRPDVLDAGREPEEVWAQLLPVVDDVARLNGLNKCPLVIHYAKFETPFLIDMHSRYSSRRGFPFKIICTHVLAKRLFPELPRRSLRAMAGYFGYSYGQARRSKDHVMATAQVWQEMVRVLEKRHGIKTLERLQQWLDQPMVSAVAERIYPMAEEIRRDLPDNPGVYNMLRSNGHILYVGKATSLKKRVDSYFRKSSRHPEHILEMLSQAKLLDVTVTHSVLEAAILESDEIKRLGPPYNVALCQGDRDVWFCSGDLREFSLKRDKRCTIGPILSRDAIMRLAAIGQMIEIGIGQNDDEQTLISALGIPEGYAPDLECLKAGFAFFLEKYATMFSTEDKGFALRQIGNKLWLERLAEKEAEIEESDVFALESVKVPIWTPDSVCHLLESNLMRGYFELRRARWLVLLNESSIAWEEKIQRKTSRHLIVLEKGQVLFYKAFNAEAIPLPPGYKSSYAERQRCFDLMTADRLRVITTEIRKAVSAERWVRVCLRPGVVLDNEKLSKVFTWL